MKADNIKLCASSLSVVTIPGFFYLVKVIC